MIAFLAAWLSALAAPDFDVLLVRPSDMTFDALAAALGFTPDTPTVPVMTGIVQAQEIVPQGYVGS